MPEDLPPHAKACLALCEAVAEGKLPAALERDAAKLAGRLLDSLGRPRGAAYGRAARIVIRGLSKERKRTWEQLLLGGPGGPGAGASPGGPGRTPTEES